MNDDRVPLFCVILQLVHDLPRDRLFSPQIVAGFTHGVCRALYTYAPLDTEIGSFEFVDPFNAGET